MSRPETDPDSRTGIDGATALVTGASRGIGAVIAAELAAAGATVVLTGRDRVALDDATRTAARVATGRAPVALAADLAVATEVSALHERANDAVGPVTLLVAAAGGLGEPAALTSLTDEQWHACLDANLTATFHTLRAFLPDMIAARHGSVVTVASTAGQSPSRASPAYGAANAGLLMLTRQAAMQVAEHGVRVNAIAPGSIHTERLDRLTGDDARARMAAAHPLGRLGTPLDVARAALHLLGAGSSWVTGATLDVNGGSLMA